MNIPSYEIVDSDGNGNIWIRAIKPIVYMHHTPIVDKDGIVETEYTEESS